MPRASWSAVLTAALAGLAALPAPAGDAAFEALRRDGKPAEIERLARERLARTADDDVALWYLASVSVGDKAKRAAAIPMTERCVADRPRSAWCHSALGRLYGGEAMTSGMVAGMRYAGRIKDSFEKAVQLAPADHDMRSDLVMYYLAAPAVVGGGARKAMATAEAYAKLDPWRGAVMVSRVLAYERKFEAAEARLRPLVPAGAEQRDLLALGYLRIAGAHQRAGDAPKALAMIDKTLTIAPTGPVADSARRLRDTLLKPKS
jgi:tetratricopeptide (TPR) repeat protein